MISYEGFEKALKEKGIGRDITLKRKPGAACNAATA